MGPYKGDFTTSDTVYVMFDSFSSDDPSASVTLTGLAVTDIEIYKNGGTTQRASDSGYALLDTDGIDFDGITGIHGFSIDLSDNTDAGFYASGGEFDVIVSSVTIDGATINFHACSFSIDRIPKVNAVQVSGTTQTARDLGASVLLSPGTGTGQVSLTSGAVTVGTNSDKTGYSLTANTGLGNQTADITGSLSGSVGSVTAGVTVTTNNDKTGYSLTATTGLGNQTANITGNLSGSVGSVAGAVGSVTGNVGGIAGTIQTLDALDTAQDTQHSTTQSNIAALNNISAAQVNAEVDTALADIGLDHLIQSALPTSWASDVASGSVFDQIADDGTAAYDRTTDSMQAIRDRGDVAWITGGGGGLTQAINPILAVPPVIDLSNTATMRIGIILTNTLDDLPTTAEITPGTITISRKAQGGTTWSAVVSAAAMTEQDGFVYYDEVFDSGSGYAEGDIIRIQFESVSVTADANTYNITGATGVYVYSCINQTMRGTDNAALASALTTAQNDLDIITGTNGVLIDDTEAAALVSATQSGLATSAALATAQTDLDTITGADGATLATAQPSITFQPLTITAGDANPNITLSGTGTSNGIAFTRSGSGNPLDANFMAQINAEIDTALTDYDAATGTELAATEAKIDIIDTNVDTINTNTAATQTLASGANGFAAIKTDTAAILIDTNELQGDWTNGGRLDLIIDAILADTGTDGVVLTAAERNAIADAILDRDMSTGADSGSTTVRTVRQALRSNRNKVTISGGTLTVYKEDDATASWTAAVTTTAGDPISDINPAGGS